MRKDELLGNSKVLRARYFAQVAHHGQFRKYTDEPYLQHCIRVAERVAGRPGSTVNMVAAAYLHDVLEDTPRTQLDLLRVFGVLVTNLVIELTDQYTASRYPYLPRRKRKELEAARLATTSDEAKVIKIADIADNTSDLVDNDPKFAAVYFLEKAAYLEALTS